MAQNVLHGKNRGAGNQGGSARPSNFAAEERERNRRRRAATHDLLVELDDLVPKLQREEPASRRRVVNPSLRLHSSRSTVQLLEDALVLLRSMHGTKGAASKRAAASSAVGVTWSFHPSSSADGLNVASPEAENEDHLRRLKDPTNPDLVHPEVLTAGLRLADGMGMFAVDLSHGWRVVEWNRGMEGVSVPSRFAKTMMLRFIVEHWPEEILSQLEAASKNLLDDGQRFVPGLSFTLALMKLYPCRDQGGKPSRVTMGYNAVTVNGVWMSRMSGRIILAFVCEFSLDDGYFSADCLSPVTVDGIGAATFSSLPPETIEGEYSLASFNGIQKNSDQSMLNMLHRTLASGSAECAGRMRLTMDRILNVLSKGFSVISSFGMHCGVAAVSPFLKASMTIEAETTIGISLDISFPKYLGGWKFPGFIQAKHTLDGFFQECVYTDGPTVMTADASKHVLIAFFASKPSRTGPYAHAFLQFTGMMYKGKNAEEAEALKRFLNSIGPLQTGEIDPMVHWSTIGTRITGYFFMNELGQVEHHAHIVKCDGIRVISDSFRAVKTTSELCNPSLQDLSLSPNSHEIRVRAWNS